MTAFGTRRLDVRYKCYCPGFWCQELDTYDLGEHTCLRLRAVVADLPVECQILVPLIKVESRRTMTLPLKRRRKQVDRSCYIASIIAAKSTMKVRYLIPEVLGYLQLFKSTIIVHMRMWNDTVGANLKDTSNPESGPCPFSLFVTFCIFICLCLCHMVKHWCGLCIWQVCIAWCLHFKQPPFVTP